MSIQVYRTISCLCHQWNIGLASCIFEKFNTEGLKYAGSSFCVCSRFTKGLNWDFILLLITYALVLPCLSAVWTQASSVLCGCWHWNFFMLYGVLFQVSMRKCTQLIYLHTRALVKYYLWATHNLHSGFLFSFKKNPPPFILHRFELFEVLYFWCGFKRNYNVQYLLNNKGTPFKIYFSTFDISSEGCFLQALAKVLPSVSLVLFSPDKSVMRNVVCVYLYVRLVQTMFQ